MKHELKLSLIRIDRRTGTGVPLDTAQNMSVQTQPSDPPSPSRYRDADNPNPVVIPPLSKLGSHPLLFAPARLAVCRLNALARFPGLPPDADLFMMDMGHPVRRVEIVGMVVGVDLRATFVKHLVDDGSGTVPCVTQIPKHKQNTNFTPQLFEIGALVRASGYVSTWDDAIQVNVLDIREEDMVALPAWWLGLVELDREVYGKPWDVMAGLRE